ncbi:Squalene synthase [Schizosaccharomyces pombe]|uniref:Squalene synthase n=1 Tax=Schizosaccharomyces pombe (strain 972 / ATCC 24843) TaxID=284812 RepID=ERG9_SCHPO|nr:putative squalene synthase Erg9 [Schizosaccharomyces pombe]P36596.1 RecName: Full=Squalene synthase; Short=SQS; Short=SS; AltName: Full=FPP:FPP farnesyltransferase; AltName: Full=Farnesyl-diphosphate farnesyltransferase [Schizosaccharomyces pombe 972h-]AAA35343.1 squalene synthetase [Schizosaccharomyces pombe]CAA22809.1 squalene synthase Erg9 (predicted) [Schizosaccharomyces pombe]|eukprot:NP_595363.1 putative squalene synthase Erg9 [Schizosaccharomyces pombe]
MSLANRIEEIRCLCQYKLWNDLPSYGEDENVPQNIRRCYQLLDMTSRSFAVVIKELPNGIREAVMIFYLVLRGLDTVEDDMTLPLDKKLPILRDFYKTIEVEGWTFNESGPNEKDRQLLVEFDVVIKEYLNLSEGYRNVISNITKEMGDGMAYYASLAEKNDGFSVETIEDFNKYCHYVAGLVGIGLSRLFAQSKLEDPDLAHSQAISNSLGLFLQKVNIIRDYREDFDDNRHFWPREIWSKYTSSFGDLCLPDNSEKALECLSDMTANALTHATDALVYLSQLKTQEIFNFCAIPQVMAIATLAAVFRNPDVFQTNVKIRKGQAVQIILHSVNLKNVCDLFLRYTRDIHYKNTPKDPNFLKISIECGKIEQVSESLFPRRFREMYEKAYVSKLSEQKKGNGTQKAILNDEQKELYRKDLQKLGISILFVFFIILVCLAVIFYVFNIRIHWSDFKELNLF